jgi:hypothetical protein
MPITSDFELAASAPDDALAQAVRDPMSSPISQIAALSELRSRQQLRQEAAAAQGAQTGTVADKILAPVGYADGGMVEQPQEKSNFFDGLTSGMPLGIMPWALNKISDGDGWKLGAIGLANELFGKNKKRPPVGAPMPVGPEIAGPMPVGPQPVGPQPVGLRNGGIVQHFRDGTGDKPVTAIPESYIKRIASYEGQNNPNARNPFGTASGLFQMIDSTRAYLDKEVWP